MFWEYMVLYLIMAESVKLGERSGRKHSVTVFHWSLWEPVAGVAGHKPN